MRNWLIIVCILICYAHNSFGEIGKNLKSKFKFYAGLSIDIGVFNTRLLSKGLYGGYMDYKFYFIRNWGTGFWIATGGVSINDTFRFKITNPHIKYSEFGWTNQYDVIHSEKIRVGLSLINGIAIVNLGDDATQVRSVSSKGYVTYHPKTIAINNFYLLEPGIDVSVRIASSLFYVTTKAKYRFLIGNCSYGELNDFSNYYLSVGLALMYL